MLNKYLPQVLLSSLLIKCLITGSSIGDALGLIGLASLVGFNLYLDVKREIPVNKEIKDRLLELEESVRETKSKVSAIVLSSPFKNIK